MPAAADVGFLRLGVAVPLIFGSHCTIGELLGANAGERSHIVNIAIACAPVLVEEVGEVEDVGGEHNLAAAVLQSEERLGKVHVDLVFPRGHVAVAVGICAAVVLGIAVALDLKYKYFL